MQLKYYDNISGDWTPVNNIGDGITISDTQPEDGDGTKIWVDTSEEGTISVPAQSGIGTIVSADVGEKTVESSIATTVGSLILTEGKWVITAQICWSSSFSDTYYVRLRNATEAANISYTRNIATNGGGVCVSDILEISDNTQISLDVYHPNASSRITSTLSYFKAIKIT